MFSSKNKIKKDECLWLFRFISIDIYQSWLMKFLMKLMLSALVLHNIVQTVLFLLKFNIHYFLTYQPVYFASFFMLSSIWSIPHIGKSMSAAIIDIHPWPINTFGSDLESRIKREAHYYNAFIALNILLSVISGFTYMLPAKSDKDIFYVVALSEEYLPQQKNILLFFFRISFIFLGFVLGTPFYISIYYCCHIKFQACLLLEFLKKLDVQVRGKKLSQLDIVRILRIYGMRHSLLNRMGKRVNTEVRIFIVLFAVTAVMLFISVISFVFTFEGSYEGIYLRVITLFLVAANLSVHIIVTGQALEDINDEFYGVLKQVSWTEWSRDNKRIYLILLANSMMSFRLQFSDSIALNYRLGVSMARSVFSVISVLVCMTK